MIGLRPTSRLLGSALVLIAFAMQIVIPGRALAAGPINENTQTFTASCTSLGEIEAVAVFPFGIAHGGSSAFLVLGTNKVVIAFTNGADLIGGRSGTSCTITAIDGQSIDPVTVFVLIVPGDVQVWDAVADFRFSPNEANPSPDSYGNSGVWGYMRSDGFAHDPSQYRLLPTYSVVDANREQWEDPAFTNVLVGALRSPSLLVLHPYGGAVIGDARHAILSWTSPITGVVSIRGRVFLGDGSCVSVGSGIMWSIDQGATTLSSSTLPSGGTFDFALSTMVQRGETLYFIVDPGFDSLCDSADLSLSITRP